MAYRTYSSDILVLLHSARHGPMRRTVCLFTSQHNWGSDKLHYVATEAHVCEQLAHGTTCTIAL